MKISIHFDIHSQLIFLQEKLDMTTLQKENVTRLSVAAHVQGNTYVEDTVSLSSTTLANIEAKQTSRFKFINIHLTTDLFLVRGLTS